MSITQRQRKTGKPFFSFTDNARQTVPQIQSRIDFNYHPSIQVEWMHISLHDTAIYWSEIDFFLEHPEELTRQLAQAGELIRTHGAINGMNIWRNCNRNTFRVYPGLHYPLLNGMWEHGERDNTHLTITEVDPLDDWKLIGLSHYVRIDQHEQALWNTKLDIEGMVREQVERGVSQGVAKAIQESTANLQQVTTEKKRIDQQIAELQHERERLEAIENRLKEREANKVNRKPKARNGYVYVIQSLTTDTYYKIGRSATPDLRISQFEVKLPFAISPVCLIQTDDMFILESDLHARYADRRVEGEWFRLSNEDLEYIRSLTGN